MKPIPLAIALLFSANAYATDYYVCDCATGADAACAAGNAAATDTANTGTNPTIPRRNPAAIQSLFNAAAANDRILLGNGCAWSNARIDLRNTNATASSRVRLESYTPSWCTGGCATQKPLLVEARAGTNAIDFDNSGADGGYVVADIELRGNGTGQWGIFTSGTVTDLEMRNLTISGFGIGVHCGENEARHRLLNSNIFDNYDQGVLWGCDQGSLIEGNTFTNNGFESDPGGESNVFLHNVYVNCGFSCYNLTIRSNILTENSILTVQCRSPSMIVHGQMDGLLIERNLVYEATGAMKNGCYGIAVDNGYGGQAEGFRNVIIRGNWVINMGSAAIGCTGCVRPVIENNVVVLEQPTGSGSMSEWYGIMSPNRDVGGEDLADTGATFRNNGVYAYWTPTDASAINVGEYSAGSGTNLTIASNLVYFGTGVNSNHHCYDWGSRVLADFTAFKANLCYHAAGNGRHSVAYSSLAAAQAAGFDADGSAADPQLTAAPTSANGWSLKVNLGSPAIDMADAVYKALRAINGYPAVGDRDTGPYEYGSNP